MVPAGVLAERPFRSRRNGRRTLRHRRGAARAAWTGCRACASRASSRRSRAKRSRHRRKALPLRPAPRPRTSYTHANAAGPQFLSARSSWAAACRIRQWPSRQTRRAHLRLPRARATRYLLQAHPLFPDRILPKRADVGGAEADRDFEIGAHAHAEAVKPVLAREFGKQREMRGGHLIHRRNAHQAANRQLVRLAAQVDEFRRVERKYTGLLRLLARVHLDEEERALLRPLEF